jgi:RIP metalloprotease RseP
VEKSTLAATDEISKTPVNRDSEFRIPHSAFAATVAKILPGIDTPLQAGDVITAVAGEKFTDLGAAVAAASCREITLLVAGKGELAVRPQINRLNGVPLAGIVMEPLPMVYQVKAGSPAEQFLTPGDFIIETAILPDGKTIVQWCDAEKIAQKPQTFPTPADAAQALRAGQLAGIEGAPAGIGWLPTQIRHRESLPQALWSAGRDTIDMSLTIYKLLQRLVTNEIPVKAMSGPVGIVSFMNATLKAPEPVMALLKLLALISINLAVFNILPFPVLDGGHLLFIAIEWIKGSPPADWVREAAQYFGVFCLLALFAYVTFNDMSRIWKNFQNEKMLEYKGDQ